MTSCCDHESGHEMKIAAIEFKRSVLRKRRLLSMLSPRELLDVLFGVDNELADIICDVGCDVGKQRGIGKFL